MPAHPKSDGRIVFVVKAGHELHLDVFLPPDATGPVPAVIWFHGGGFMDGCSTDFADTQVFPTLSRGWALVCPEYRLAPQVLLPDIVEDVKDACAFVASGKLDEKLGGGKVDGARWAVTGSSAGGLLALLGGYQSTPPPKAVFGLYPATDVTHPSFNAKVPFPKHISWESVSQYFPVDGPIVSHAPANVDFSTFTVGDRTASCFYALQEGIHLKTITGTEDAAKLQPLRAATHIKPDSPPTIIVHGTDDLMVPYQLAEEFVAALKKAGVEHELVTVRGANHGFDLAPGVIDDKVAMEPFERAYNFLGKYLA